MRRTVGVALVVLAAGIGAARISAHDLERTQVLLTFARDGSFVLDVANDPSWLKLRLEPFRNNFIDRIVLFVDGHEVRPTSVEYIDGSTLGTHRLRGRMPVDARMLRWYYGLVVDPYPLTIRRADGRVQVEEIQGDAWSRPIDLSGQFQGPRRIDRLAPILIVALLLIPLVLRVSSARKKRNYEDRQETRPRRSTQNPQKPQNHQLFFLRVPRVLR
ncbi:MAG TPA: hypothetical protein VGQ16_06510 [Vicinamibacterales bacterium]|nr:hypothetical protein [Vicinamibacterales bacterium]